MSSPMHTNIAVDVEFSVLKASGNLRLHLLSVRVNMRYTENKYVLRSIWALILLRSMQCSSRFVVTPLDATFTRSYSCHSNSLKCSVRLQGLYYSKIVSETISEGQGNFPGEARPPDTPTWHLRVHTSFQPICNL